MEQLSNHEGWAKWGVVAASVIAMECVGSKSLSTHCREAIQHPIGKVAIPVLIGITALHLLDMCPPAIDIYEHIGSTVERLRNGTS